MLMFLNKSTGIVNGNAKMCFHSISKYELTLVLTAPEMKAHNLHSIFYSIIWVSPPQAL